MKPRGVQDVECWRLHASIGNTREECVVVSQEYGSDLLKRIDDESDGRVPTLLTLKVRFIATDSSISRTLFLKDAHRNLTVTTCGCL